MIGQNMKEYKIINSSIITLNTEVTNYLREGWQLYGNPFGEGNLLYQAITRDYND
jgi:hypothetical protein